MRQPFKFFMVVWSLILISFFLSFIGCWEEKGQKDIIYTNQQLHNYFSRLADRGFSGAVLVEKNDTIILQNGYGVANDDLGTKVQPETVFNIASLGKQFTAAAVLKLQEDGKLDLQMPISKYINVNWPEKLKNATVHQFLTHTSGITEYYQPASISFTNKDDFLNEVFKVQEPTDGNAFSYSNTGYEILAILIEEASGVSEEVSGVSYEEYLRKKFFEPLKMDNTGFIGEKKWDKDFISKGFGGALNKLASQGNTSYGNKGAGSVVCNIIDLYKWEKAIRENKMFDKKTTEQWFKKHTIAEVETLFYGYGWRMNDTERDTDLIWHSGWDDAFSSIYYRFPDEDATIIFLSNYAVGLDPIRNVIFPALKTTDLEKIMFSDTTLVNKTPVQFTERDLNQYIGKYLLDDNNFVVIEKKKSDNCLSIKPYGQELVNYLFDYQEQSSKMDSITSNIRTLLSELKGKKNSINNVIEALGPFDEYDYYQRGNEWAGNEFKKIFEKFGTLDNITMVGTAHSYGTRLGHTETNFDVALKDTVLNYSYINYSGEKYLVPNGANTFRLFLCGSDAKSEFVLQDIMQRFVKKTISFSDETELIIRGEEDKMLTLKKLE